MRICFIAYRINKPVTGGEYYNEALLEGARRSGLQVFKWEGIAFDRIRNQIIRTILLNIFYLIKSIRLSKKDILIFDTDFHARAFSAILWARYISRSKVIGMLHLYYYLLDQKSIKGKFHWYIERFISCRFDMVIVNSNFSFRSFQNLTKKSIPHQILTPFCKETKKQSFPKVYFDKKELKIIQVGTIENRKNVVNAIEAISRVKVPFRLEFIGHCSSQQFLDSVTNLVKSKGLEHKVFFRGNADRPTLHNHYVNSTVFLLVSRLETYGMVYAEAMQYGLPIIGSTTGSVPELVEHKVNGFLCDPESPDQIAEAITRLSDKEEWERISTNNYKKASTLMDKETFILNSQSLFNVLKQEGK